MLSCARSSNGKRSSEQLGSWPTSKFVTPSTLASRLCMWLPSCMANSVWLASVCFLLADISASSLVHPEKYLFLLLYLYSVNLTSSGTKPTSEWFSKSSCDLSLERLTMYLVVHCWMPRQASSLPCMLHTVWPLNIQKLFDIWSCVESPYHVRCLIRKKCYNCIAIVNIGTSSFGMPAFWILLKKTNEKRACLNV